MKTYVQSRGKSQKHDHCWLEFREGDQQLTVPLEIKEIQPGELIDSQKPSIILARSHNRLILLITALQTRDGRTDFMGRQIRNSVAWIATDGGDKEQLFRKITIQALEGNLASAVDGAVNNDPNSDYGFTVDFDKLEAIKNSIDCQKISSEKENSSLLRIGSDNEQLRADLISELTKYELPNFSSDIQILVVVTTMKSEKGLKEKDVWRGLSSRIESEGWQDFFLDPAKPHVHRAKTITFVFIGGLIASVVTIAILILTLYHAHQHIQPKELTPVQPSPAETTSQIPLETLPQ